MNTRLRFIEILLLLTDLSCIISGQFFGIKLWQWLRPNLSLTGSHWIDLWWGAPLIMPLWLITTLMILWMWKTALYNPYRYTTSLHMIEGVTKAGFGLLISTICLEFLLPSRRYARLLVILVCLSSTIGALFGRVLFFKLQKYFQIPLPKQRFAIVGVAENIPHLVSLLCGRWPHVTFCGTLSAETNIKDSEEHIGHIDNLPALINIHNLDTIVVGTQTLNRARIMSLTTTAERMGIRVLQLPLMWGLAEPYVTLRPLGNLALIDLNPKEYSSLDTQLKRALDLALCSVGGLLISPLLLIVALLIYLQDGGPILFIQPRTGKGGRSFPFYKFRTMIPNAESQRDILESQNESDGPLFKIKNDPRITPWGAWLRKTSIDELPQIWNVLRGDMNLVGPRPLPLADIEAIQGKPEAEYWYEQRVKVKPGITGLWQISGRSNLGFDAMIRYDMEYIHSWSLWLDIGIIVKTLPAVIKRQGAH